MSLNGDDQSWDVYKEFFNDRFLPAVSGKIVIFMAGNVHDNRLPPRVDDRPVEVVSSAAWVDGTFSRFGVLQVSDGEVNAFLYRNGKIEYTSTLNLLTGSYATSMEALLKYAAAKPSAQRAQAQRHNALRHLHKEMTGRAGKRIRPIGVDGDSIEVLHNTNSHD